MTHKKTGAPFTIRRYRLSDCDAVWALHNLALDDADAHLGPGPWDDDFKRIKEIYLNGDGEFLVAFHEDRLAGMGALKKTDNTRAEIKRMRVHPDFQRQGLGQMLLDALEARALALGYRVLDLDTTTQQVAGQKLYEKNGYQQIGRSQDERFKLILYEKSLD